MPMSREEHEALLVELLNPEIDHSRRTDILQMIRVDHVKAHDEVETLTTSNDKFKKDNDDLLLSNSKLFRQLDITGNNEPKPEVKQKEFSETVTIEELEKNI